MADNNDTLFREIDEELRREQFAKLWERYGIYAIAVAILIVALVGGAKLWESRRLAEAQATGAEYEAATALATANKTEEAAKAYEAIAAGAPKGYAALAKLAEAGADLKLNKRAEALAIFDGLVADASIDTKLANFARLQAASLRLGEADFTEMENRLKPLVGDDSSWRNPARELLGMAALKAGKLDVARTTLTPLLADPSLPRATGERIGRLMAGIASAELSGTPGPAPATTPAPAAGTDPAASSAPTSTMVPGKVDAEKPASAP
jgi:hypothetical protein